MQLEITRNGDTATVFLSEGRVVWTVEKLIRAGKRGITSLENPAPRLAAYIHKAKKAGVPIDKVTELHDGEFSGHHARYFIGEGVRIVGGEQ